MKNGKHRTEPDNTVIHSPRVSEEAADLLPMVDAVIFDIDGVLLDVSQSIRAVNCMVVPAYLNRLHGWYSPEDLLTSEEIEQFKRAGGFNDDWELTCAVVLLYLYKSLRYGSREADQLHRLSPTIEQYTQEIGKRGGWLHSAEAYLSEMAKPEEWEAIMESYDPSLIARLFQELWAGDACEQLYSYKPTYYPGPGKCREDRPLLDASLVPAHRRLAVLTGRTRLEASFALEMVGLRDRILLPEYGMTRDEGNQKPDPDGLRRLVARLHSQVALYIGDSLDDLRTVLNFRALPESRFTRVLSAQVLTGTVGRQAIPLFATADILAPDVNSVLRLFQQASIQRPAA